MIVYNSFNAGPFVYCNYYQGINETNTYYNEVDGHYHAWIYIVSGQATAEIRDTADLTTTPLYTDDQPPGSLVDQRRSKGKYVTTITTDQGCGMMMFNPIPQTDELSIEIVTGAQTKTVTATDKRITIVCITGPITANGINLNTLEHAKIFPGKTVEIVSSDTNVYALVR